MATDKRQLRLTISSILEQYKIDNIELEMKLTDAACKFFEETKKGQNPVRARENILDVMLANANRYQIFDDMQKRMEVALKLHIDGNNKWCKVVNHCLNSKDNQTIEQYVEWCARDPYNSPKAHQIAMNPEIIIATWPQAFTEPEKEPEIIHAQPDPLEGLYTPAPGRPSTRPVRPLASSGGQA